MGFHIKASISIHEYIAKPFPGYCTITEGSIPKSFILKTASAVGALQRLLF
ncbi:hypothetical protein GCD22_00357 [Acidithiobacillus thiooxidans ATCC 19377]|uniref:Uncharacterized protein n=1 Tax=Acidithiobacillus thiooxidans ATCC 19377 TaxID=637390 RepID=A0A5P9XP12_ACITH|nr:hypothetical protein GCD22_00357 [Acidithiobacillus thiooxidans ATCC 19377]